MANTNTIDALRTRMHPYWNPTEAGGIYLMGAINDDAANGAILFDLLSLHPSIDANDPDRWELLAEALAETAGDFLTTYELHPGTYEIENDHAAISENGAIKLNMWGDAVIDVPKAASLTFTFTQQHLSLIRSMNTRAYGAYVELMDCKRPYGDMTYYYIDMALALNEAIPRDDKGKPAISAEAQERYQTLHAEMLFAVQAFWRHASAPTAHQA